ncbi:hypothetical protein N7519_001501 [Penicillium mononematosum]|uniref:uncharacterized protein n=1 Tax=Penicillium mononematosum TaxID=268346 RepID=UPI0025497B23|nr:uncharacterized protein N7519_001501 [Penicillium mononematosum]KAJ6191480.1 hypothetical protein N7519_001501 [Penicillium mononematosum]
MARQSGRDDHLPHRTKHADGLSTRVLLLDINAAGYLVTGMRGRDGILSIGDDKIKVRKKTKNNFGNESWMSPRML